MRIKVLYDNPSENILARLLKVRNINDNIENFLNPSFKTYRKDPFLLDWMEIAIERIIKAINSNERIMILWDYDVDGITSTAVVYEFFKRFLGYKNISVRLPHRLRDWYGIKDYHLDEIKQKGVSLVITVDNWITAVNEALYAKKLWLDLIITDHHTPLEILPEALAVINPKTSSKYPFKELAGVGVAFKLITALASKFFKEKALKKKVISYFLPIVAIWTVADCVPLIDENRLFVKKWLEILNKRNNIHPNIEYLLNFLNLKKVDTFHIWYVIWPRLNASGRLQDPYNSFFSLVSSNKVKQKKYLEILETLNKQRQNIQENYIRKASSLIDKRKKILVVYDPEFHEWVVWIIAWRLAEKYNRPSIVLTYNKEKDLIVGSLRWPDYFNIVEMLKEAWPYLVNFGWHKQAWWLSLKKENLDKVISIFENYCNANISDVDLEKEILVDTYIYPFEINSNDLNLITKLAPFGEWNPEPLFLIDDVKIIKKEVVWQKHLKIWGDIKGSIIEFLYWNNACKIDEIDIWDRKKIICKVKKDKLSSNWYYFEIVFII